MTDKRIRALAFDDMVRVVIINAQKSVQEAHDRHDTWHTATAALGRSLIGSALLASTLKGDDRLQVDIQGSGPIGRITVDVDGKGFIRAAIQNPHVALGLNEAGKIDVSGGIGLPGTLTVTKHIQDGQPYTGQVPLVSGELGDDFTYYMAVSEQIPSAVGVSVLVESDESVRAAGGFMIQMLPNATEEVIQEVEDRIAKLGLFSTLLDQGYSLVELLDKLVGEKNHRVISEEKVTYFCPCNKAYYADRLAVIGTDELKAIIEEDQQAEVVCHYCNTAYHYTLEELEEIYQSASDQEGHK